jgi:hypothetical protein
MRDKELLTRSIEEWRRPVRIRAEWRDALLNDIANHTVPRVNGTPHRNSPPRVWTLRPLTALAAAISLIVLGLAAGIVVSRDSATGVAVAPNANPVLTTVRFVIVAPTARQVSLVGDFNRWDASANPMRPAPDGQRWELEVALGPGRHTYAFVVDGDVMRDPTAPSAPDDDFGVPNSVIFVAAGRT